MGDGNCNWGATEMEVWYRVGSACLSGYSGDDCDIDIDECLSSPCLNGATCSDSTANAMVPADSFVCACVEGFAGELCEISVTTGFVLVDSHIEGVTNPGLALIEANLPAGTPSRRVLFTT